MKTTRIILTLIIAAAIGTAAGCNLTSYDNYDKPESTLTGAIVHEGDTLRVRSNAVELEIWEDGYEDYEKIPVFVDQDGTFSAKLFDGEYKITELIGSGPWVPNSDTLTFNLNGNHEMQFEVEPYVKVTGSDIRIDGDSIVADFNLEQVNASSDITFLTLFLGTSRFVSKQNNSYFWNHLQQGTEPNANGANTLSPSLSTLPDQLANRDYVFARVAIEIAGKEDALYTKVYKLEL